MDNNGNISAAWRFDREFFERPPHTRHDEELAKPRSLSIEIRLMTPLAEPVSESEQLGSLTCLSPRNA
jgi:hypothetical protein